MDKPTKHPVLVSSRDDSLKSGSEIDTFDDVDEKKVMRRVDFRLVPLFTILYLLSFLDRGNIGNAKIEGLADDLKLVGNQYNLCLTIFFIFYASLEVPANVILKHVNPRFFIPATMVLWSIVMTCMGTVNNFHQLLATRALLGVFECAAFPGISFLLSVYYKKKEILVREAIFFSAASLAGAFSGLLAAAISKMDGVGGYAGWRWIFILEGLLTFLVSLAAFFLFPDYPERCQFLNERERAFLVHRVKYASNVDGDSLRKRDEEVETADVKLDKEIIGEDDANDTAYIWAVFKDWQSWLQLITYYGVCVPLYGISLFAPTIINNLGFGSTKSQLLSVPVYTVAAIASIFQAVVLNKVGLRSPFLVLNYVCMAVGYIVCITGDPLKNPKGIYAGIYIIALGIYPAFPLVVIWFSNNLSGKYKRAVGMAFQIGVGNFSGAFASNFYRTQDAPRYILGHALELGFIGMGACGLVLLIVGYTWANSRKQHHLQEGTFAHYTDVQLMKMGDKSPYFKYRL